MDRSRTRDPNQIDVVFNAAEQENFQRIARAVMPSPGQIPRTPGLDVYGECMALRGVIGGDHIIYLEFNQRFDLDRRIGRAERQGQSRIARRLEETRSRAGILLADVAGHHKGPTSGLVGSSDGYMPHPRKVTPSDRSRAVPGAKRDCGLFRGRAHLRHVG